MSRGSNFGTFKIGINFLRKNILFQSFYKIKNNLNLHTLDQLDTVFVLSYLAVDSQTSKYEIGKHYSHIADISLGGSSRLPMYCEDGVSDPPQTGWG